MCETVQGDVIDETRGVQSDAIDKDVLSRFENGAEEQRSKVRLERGVEVEETRGMGRIKLMLKI